MSLTFKSWKRIAFSFVALLLCFILILAPFRVLAVAGVDDALFLLLVAVLASSGVTFASVADAHTGCDAFWNNLDTVTQNQLLQKADAILGASGIASVTTVGMNFLIDQWTNIIQGITATFGDYTGTDAVVNVGRSGILTADDPMMSFDVTYNPGSYIVYKVSDNLSVSFIGTSSDGTVPAYLNMDMSVPSCVCHYVNVAGVFSGGQRLYVSTPHANKYNISLSYVINDIIFNSPQSRGIFQYYQGQPLSFNRLSNNKFTMTVDGINIVQDGYLMNTSISVPSSVCPDGIWNSDRDYVDWLNDLIFGNSADLGNPGIDATAYPGNDVWHDGSIRDDVDVGSPSIGISVPTDLSDDVIGTLSPDVARDYENTDVKEKDIATTETDVNPDEETDNPTNDKPSKIVPALSLPEVLFQHKFPFCLPYDIYAMCLGLRSDNAEPPVFSVPYRNNTLNIDLEYEINFEDFDEVISILRFFVGATFTGGLIFATRKLIWK